MKRPLTVWQSFMRGCLTGIMICLNVSAHAQQEAPKLLRDAAHCLTIKGFLPTPRTATISSGYLVDSDSYPGDRVLFVVVYATSQRSRGMVFSIFLTNKGKQQVFDIQNKGEFVRSRKESAAFRREGVDFIDGGDPLGGIWTQEHIALAIRKISRQPIIEVPVKNLTNPSISVQCESYADIKK